MWRLVLALKKKIPRERPTSSALLLVLLNACLWNECQKQFETSNFQGILWSYAYFVHGHNHFCQTNQIIRSSHLDMSILYSELPFYGQEISLIRFQEDGITDSTSPHRDNTSYAHVKILESKSNHLRLLRLNIQSMTSTFNELVLTVQR